MWNAPLTRVVPATTRADSASIREEAALGALRRPKQQNIEEKEDLQGSAQVAAAPKSSYPRWAVVSGLIVYCALFWAVVVAAGIWGVQWVHTAAAALH